MQSGIYEIVNITNGKRYVGSAINLKQRWIMHRSYLNNGKHQNAHLQRAWKKYGEGSFEFRVVRKVHPSCLIIIEQVVISSYSFDTLYNICKVAGSMFGVRFKIPFRKSLSIEGRRALSEAKKGKPGVRLGMKHSTEAKLKMSNARKGKPSPKRGKPVSEEQKKKISETLKQKRLGIAS